MTKSTAKKITKRTAKKIVEFALEKKADEVLLMDLRKLTPVTDFFIICSGGSDTQVRAIADNVVERCKEAGIFVYNVEGYESLSWVLIDLVEVVVHVFQRDTRAYYQLERLWRDAPTDRFGSEEEAAN
ncbi:MAG: ribosome silencing factor [Candidatus Krumholzibacteria bacterium]|nr:ribosome silencing factor [Candidatus Krumholzibacteria bacterium]